MLVWKLWTVYTGMFAVTAILSCVIKIRGLFKSTKCGRLKMSNLKLSQPGVKCTPGLFKVEFKGDKIIGLCSKSYCTERFASV